MAVTNQPEHQGAESEPRDRLARVRVLGLFGMFDHEIPFNLDSHITVIYGPNGVGKTIVLRVIHELLSAEPDVLTRVPFEKLELEFESGDRIGLCPETFEGDSDVSNNLKCEIVLNSESHEATLFAEPDLALIQQVTSHLGSSWRYKGVRQWVDDRDGEVLGVDDLTHRVPLPEKDLQSLRRKDDPVLNRIREKCKVRLIGTDRLLVDVRDSDADITPRMARELWVFSSRWRRPILSDYWKGPHYEHMVFHLSHLLNDKPGDGVRSIG